jgi:hypothetical protein
MTRRRVAWVMLSLSCSANAPSVGTLTPNVPEDSGEPSQSCGVAMWQDVAVPAVTVSEALSRPELIGARVAVRGYAVVARYEQALSERPLRSGQLMTLALGAAPDLRCNGRAVAVLGTLTRGEGDNWHDGRPTHVFLQVEGIKLAAVNGESIPPPQ